MASLSAPIPIVAHGGLGPGAIIGNKYRIDGVLGQGGMGLVFSATHLELGAQVAIKIVRDELARDEAVVSRLLFEAQAVALMRSAHIVRVLDVARLPSGAPYIVMEHLQGSDLAAVLARHGPLSVRDVTRCLLQACDGIAEAHKLGIVHRDLKPENLFLTKTPEGVVLKVLDFGISKNIGSVIRTGKRSTLTGDGAAVGSPSYMAPEQMRALASLDGRADIWSLGAILFELLTGRCPFEAASPALLFAKVLCEPAPSLLSLQKNVPVELDAIVQRCLKVEPRDRFQSVTELAGALREFAGREPRAEHARLESGINLNQARAQFTSLPDVNPPRPRKYLPLISGCLSFLLAFAGVDLWRMFQAPNTGQRQELSGMAAVPAPSPMRLTDSVPVVPPPVPPFVTPAVGVTPQASASSAPNRPPTPARWWKPPVKNRAQETTNNPSVRYGL